MQQIQTLEQNKKTSKLGGTPFMTAFYCFTKSCSIYLIMRAYVEKLVMVLGLPIHNS